MNSFIEFYKNFFGHYLLAIAFGALAAYGKIHGFEFIILLLLPTSTILSIIHEVKKEDKLFKKIIGGFIGLSFSMILFFFTYDKFLGTY